MLIKRKPLGFLESEQNGSPLLRHVRVGERALPGLMNVVPFQKCFCCATDRRMPRGVWGGRASAWSMCERIAPQDSAFSQFIGGQLVTTTAERSAPPKPPTSRVDDTNLFQLKFTSLLMVRHVHQPRALPGRGRNVCGRLILSCTALVDIFSHRHTLPDPHASEESVHPNRDSRDKT